MAHIHDLIDFTVTIYIVFDGKILLIDHKELKKWLPVGGHIELDEHPDQAVIREAKEESDLEVRVVAEKPAIVQPGSLFLYRPEGINVHNINSSHRHVDLIYFAKAKSDQTKLQELEHNDIRWFRAAELNDPKYKIEPAVKFYAKKALKKVAKKLA